MSAVKVEPRNKAKGGDDGNVLVISVKAAAGCC
jgi:hypothetical protein